MERDKKLGKILREDSLLSPPVNFTASVLDKISETPVKIPYKPLIGKKAAYSILSLVVLMLLISIFGSQTEVTEPLISLPKLDLSLPDWKIDFSKITWKIPTGVMASVLAVFILVLSDAGISRSRS